MALPGISAPIWLPGERSRRKQVLAFELEQGDCIYIPRGFAHDAVSQHGSSVHITLSPHPPVWRLALAQVMHELVKELPEIEQSLPVGYARRPAEETANELAAWLQRLSSFNLVPATQRMIDQNLEDFRGLFYGALERRLAGEPADPECRYVKNAELITHQELSDEACVVKTPRKTVDFPPLFRRQLEYCLSGRVFKASDIPGMAPDEQMVLLDRLLAEGLVVRAEN